MMTRIANILGCVVFLAALAYPVEYTKIVICI